MKRARVLVVDDKERFLSLFRRIAPPDLEVVCSPDGARALELLTAEPFDLVISDVRMPGLDGLSLLRRVREAGIEVDVIMMTAYGTIADAVRAMKYGAVDYLTKPFDPDDAVVAIEQALSRRRARWTSRRELESSYLRGESAAMKRLLQQIERANTLPTHLLIRGESGTGKELVARATHAASARANGPFLAVKCGLLPGPSLVGELFGSGDGVGPTSSAGLVERAGGGALFLDDVEELPALVQTRLASALERRVVRRRDGLGDQPIDVRVIGATSLDLRRRELDGLFSRDLLEQLSCFELEVPSLRARREDIPLVVEGILARISAAGESEPRSLSDDAMACLLTYHWPGNLVELEMVLGRAAAMTTSRILDASVLPPEVRGAETPSRSRPPPALASLPYREAIALERERATREYLIALLRDVNGNVTHAAERAGIERESFHRLMKRHNVRAEDYRAR